jgi:methylated-DNA-[protein]-cysteine S-methyltransferase
MNDLQAIEGELGNAFAPDDGQMADLVARLASAAESQDLVDVAFRRFDSPIGMLLLAATPRGLVRVGLANEDEGAVLQELAERVSPRVLEAPRRLDLVAVELDRYFAGQLREFDLALDHRLSAGFRHIVLTRLAEIPYGETASYAAVAALAGSPAAARAVGTACATNPIPIVIPCHRVTRADGTLGGYRGGSEAKRALIHLEQGV